MQEFKKRIVLLFCCITICLATLIWRMPATVSADATVSICGNVTSFTAATATTPGMLVIGGTTIPVAVGTTITGQGMISIGANMCLTGTLNAGGQAIAPSSVATNSGTSLTVCGVVPAFTAATGSALGSITVGGTTYPIAAGTTLTNQGLIIAGSNLCLSATFNGAGQIVAPSSITVTAGTTVNLCGVVNAFTAATSSTSGSLNLGGTIFPIAAGTTLGSQALIITGTNLCLSSSVNASGQLIAPSSVVVNANSTVSVCGPVTAFTAATATVGGSINVGGTTLAITPGTTLTGVTVGSNLCLSASLNILGQVIPPATLSTNAGITQAVCGVVTAFTAATGTVSGALRIGGVNFIIAPGVTLGSANLITVGANVCLTPVFNASGQLAAGSTAGSPSQGGPTNCPQLAVPAITKGFNTQDVFALSQPLVLTLTSTADAGVTFFNVNATTFGGTVVGVGGLTGLNSQGVGFSTPSGTLNLLSCLDSIWDIVFEIAGTGNTVGDRVTLFLTTQGGAAVSIASFTIEAGGARVTTINSGVRLFLNNRQANGTALSVGTLISFGTAAGAAGNRTLPIVLNVLMDPGSPFNSCTQLGVNITRGAGVGTTSLLVTDIQVMRNELPGDRARAGTGLLNGTTGGFPTGAFCAAICPSCPVVGNFEQGPSKCNTMCFRSPGFFLLRPNRLPNGAVVVPGVNFNIALDVQSNLDLINGVLQGNGMFGGAMTPAQRFTQQFVTAQINLINGSAGGALETDVLWTNLSCYGLTFAPVTLSNGVGLSPASMLKDLFMQANFMTGNPTRTNADLNALSDIFALLNGNNLVGCNVIR